MRVSEGAWERGGYRESAREWLGLRIFEIMRVKVRESTCGSVVLKSA